MNNGFYQSSKVIYQNEHNRFPQEQCYDKYDKYNKRGNYVQDPVLTYYYGSYHESVGQKYPEKENFIRCVICKINKVYGGKNKCEPCLKPKINKKFNASFSKKIKVLQKTPEDNFICATIYGGESGFKDCITCNGNNSIAEFRSGNTIGPK